MISGLVSLFAIVVVLAVWGIIVHKWATGDVLPSERKQRTWLFVPTYVLIIIAAAGIGFLVSTILQPPAPPPPSNIETVGSTTIIKVPLSRLGSAPDLDTAVKAARAQLEAEGWKADPITGELSPLVPITRQERVISLMSLVLGFMFLVSGLVGFAYLPKLAKGRSWLHRYCAYAGPIFALLVSFSSFYVAYGIVAKFVTFQ